jgi:hypothetical protein
VSGLCSEVEGVGQQGILFHFILSADNGMRRQQIDRAIFLKENMLLSW